MAFAEEWYDDAFRRAGYDPEDPATWEQEFMRMEPTKSRPFAEAAPRAYRAMCDLANGGGEERLATARLSDTMIMNLGAARGSLAYNPHLSLRFTI